MVFELVGFGFVCFFLLLWMALGCHSVLKTLRYSFYMCITKQG